MSALDIRALVLVNTEPSFKYDPLPLAAPPALYDVVGQSPLLRVVERLQRCGVSPVTAVVAAERSFFPSKSLWPAHFECRSSLDGDFWQTAEDTFGAVAQSGADLVILIRLGAYAEVEFEKMAQAHLERHCRVSQALCADQALEIFCVTASRRNDAASLFRSRFQKCRSECPAFIHTGYMNPLADARDLRQLGIDILTLQTKTRPSGSEVRPGVWIAPGVGIDPTARVIAPAFIGTSARVGAGAVVTRCTAIEHGARVDCGTVVENSTVLASSYVGAGLDLAHSVVGMGRIANLRRNTTVEVADRNLIGHSPARGMRKLLRLTEEFLSALSAKLRRETKPETPVLPPALEPAPPAPDVLNAAPETPAGDIKDGEMAGVRTHGDQ
jgi:carbonic anhydrase/acetyltransferase-like protein (isoleucine patch superfamily)